MRHGARVPSVLALSLILLWGSCDEVPTVPQAERPVVQANVGMPLELAPRLFFLPPLVPEPQLDGVFDPSLDPLVEICE